MNKKLPQKLAAKARKVQAIVVAFPRAHASHVGQKAYTAIEGSYGKTINPYHPSGERLKHKEFRNGFIGAKAIAKQSVELVGVSSN